MKKLFLLLILTSCSHDCPEYDPCDCNLVVDPFTHNSTENGVTTYVTQFVIKNECTGLNEPAHHVTTNINEIPKEFECYKPKN